MKSLLILSDHSKNKKKTAVPLLKMAHKERSRNIAASRTTNSKLKSEREPWYKFYKVFKNDTVVKLVSTNNFRTFMPAYLKIKAACALNSRKHPAFFLMDDYFIFHEFLSQIKAMEYAKAGALKYISKLIDEGEKSYKLLLKYREAHYDDLNINLVDSNIRKMELAPEVTPV